MNIPIQANSSLNLPASLANLEPLAYNLRWTWDRQTQDHFSKIAPEQWAANDSPVKILRECQTWPALEKDAEFLQKISASKTNLDRYLAAPSGDETRPVAYFCAEYAFHTSMNQYAGGLGILAGDHCKEASDRAFPFIAVGLFYRRGFFHQMVDWSGRQEARYPTYIPEDLPMKKVLDPKTNLPLTISVEFPGRDVYATVWLMQIGRTPLLLLDTDLPQNWPEDRKITSQLYTNQREMRLYQEAILGIGGVRVLHALQIEPSCFHLNEGHSALLLLERIRALIAGGHGLHEAMDEVRSTSILTIHTPVPEGNERFDSALVDQVLKRILEDSSLTERNFLSDGLGADKDPKIFDMTAFALRHTAKANGVSLLHGQTADKTWSPVVGRSIQGVTNGAHMPTWLGPEMRALFERHGANFDQGMRLKLGPEPRPRWLPALELDAKELWEAHLAQKMRLIAWAQNRLFEEHARHGEGPSKLAKFEHALDPNAFLIGFARRFATYKRAALLFSDLKRVVSLFNLPEIKIQILFAGKSHPSDRAGQRLVEDVFALSQSKEFIDRVFLLEDYDMETGAHLVQGVDLWLNNPRRPLEASGTSGMKAAANGVPNLSILDGWWDEAYRPNPRNGWAIGDRVVPADVRAQDRKDVRALYRTLEREVIPTFLARDGSGVPHQWVEIMRQSIADTLYVFSSTRMLRDYAEEMYAPSHKEAANL
jgi:starch phosphorylase